MKSTLKALTNKAPVPYSASRNLSLPSIRRNNAEMQMAAMGAVGTLFSIVNRTSNATSQVAWHLYKKIDPRKGQGQREEVTNHLALDIWNKPNQFFTRQEHVEASQQHLDLTGESYWVIAKNPNMNLPLELWAVRPDRMTPVPHPTEYLTNYIYTGPNGEQIPLKREDVIQLRMPNPLDPYRGMGPVQSILTDIDSSAYAAEYNKNFFLNSAEPGGIIEVDKRLTDDEFDEMVQRWREQHQGVAQAHRVAILEQGKYVPQQYTMRDMQFAQLRDVSREVIREAFGFPKPMLGAVDNVNRANAEAGELMFARWLIIPRLERIKQALNNDFLPQFGITSKGLEFDYDSPVPEDRAADDAERNSKATAAQTLIQAGFDPHDVLDIVGLPYMNFIGGGNNNATS